MKFDQLIEESVLELEDDYNSFMKDASDKWLMDYIIKKENSVFRNFSIIDESMKFKPKSKVLEELMISRVATIKRFHVEAQKTFYDTRNKMRYAVWLSTATKALDENIRVVMISMEYIRSDK